MDTKYNEKIEKMIQEVQRLLPFEDLLHCLNKVIQSMMGLGSCRFVNLCFNKELVNDMSMKLRENGISSEIPMDEDAIMRATCCYHLHGCSECRAVCCLRDLLALPEGQNALLNPELCEKVCRCVLNGAGIFDLSLLFALLRTSPDFGEDSLILFALENCINQDKRSETVEIGKMFFEATRKLKLRFLTFESRFSADTRREKNAELRKMELELCGTAVYATKIAQIQEEEAAAAAALLEVKKSKMSRCCVCLDDPIKKPPIFGSRTCGHKICCEECVHMVDLNEKVNYRCPLCRKQFTDADVWWCLGNPVDED